MKIGKKNLGIKKVMIFIFLYAVTCIGGTYAYFALSAENSNTIVGVTADPSLDLDVSKVIPTSNNTVMVPQLEKALGTAISSQYNCIDGNGNTVCQVFRVDVTNDGTGNVRINGTISFNGIDDMPNLKWKRLENATTVNTNYTSKTASTMDVAFDTDLLLEKDDSKTYYFVVWIDETGRAQTDNGTFGITINFNSGQGEGVTSTIGSTPYTPFIDEVMAVNAVSDSNIDFFNGVESTNGIYLRSGTEEATNPIYYYRGNVNNNLIFADMCFKIVRTTETGGLKLIYNGVPSNGQCNNTGTASQISTKAFNTAANELLFLNSLTKNGYMYTELYESEYYDGGVYDNKIYGNDVIYSNGMYTLVDTISGEWDDLYDGELNTYHYTCFTSGNSCESVDYIFYSDFFSYRSIILTDGDKIETALNKIFGSDDNNKNLYNVNSSTIKGNNTTTGTVDYWYYNNIEQRGYTNYIEDTVWCNDRSIYSLGGFEPNGGIVYDGFNTFFNTEVIFGESGRFAEGLFAETGLWQPGLTCNRNIDKFTVSEEFGNGDLDYPVGLITLEEYLLATNFLESNNYLYTGSSYWTMTPATMSSGVYINQSGEPEFGTNESYFMIEHGVRPSISLKAGFAIASGGDGSGNNPYVVE